MREMAIHLVSLLYRSWVNLMTALGTTTLGILIFSLMIPGLTLCIVIVVGIDRPWSWAKLKMTLKEAIKPTLISFAATAIILLVLFSGAVIIRIYEDHQFLVKANSHKLELVKSQKKQIEGLEEKIKEQPKVVYREKVVEKVVEPQGLAEAKAKSMRQSQELEETKAALATETKESNELKKKMEELSLANKNKGIAGFVQQLAELEKLSKTADHQSSYAADANAVRALALSYNELLTAIKKELNSDPYVQARNMANTTGDYAPVLSYLRSSIPQLRIYLEQRYLK
jgi:hypothetical protein